MQQPQAPSSEDITAEREALEDLIGSKGWEVFVRYTAREWKGTGYYARMNAVLKSDKPTDAVLIHQCSEAVIALVTWPDRRVSELRGETKK